MTDISIYSINALLILDNQGKRIYAKYYKAPHSENKENTQKTQLTFEKELFAKTNHTNNEILLFNNTLVTYKTFSDVIIYMTSPLDENELLLSTVFNNFCQALEITISPKLDKSMIESNYDKLTLTIDETIDDGIVLEYDAAVIASRVTDAPVQDAPSLKNIDLSEKGFMNAFSFARAKLSETLQQGL